MTIERINKLVITGKYGVRLTLNKNAKSTDFAGKSSEGVEIEVYKQAEEYVQGSRDQQITVLLSREDAEALGLELLETSGPIKSGWPKPLHKLTPEQAEALKAVIKKGQSVGVYPRDQLALAQVMRSIGIDWPPQEK